MRSFSVSRGMGHSAGERRFWNRVVETAEPPKFANDAEKARIFELLGDLEGKDLLECGCGFGIWSVALAQRGARVWAFDISEKSVAETTSRAYEANVGHIVKAQIVDFHNLPYGDEAFDLMFGSMILHHVDAHVAGGELSRVLKVGGKAVFHENSDNNPLLMFLRDTVVGRFGVSKTGTPDEYPLTAQQIETMGEYFVDYHVHFSRFMFFELASKVLFRDSNEFIARICESADRLIYAWLPFSRRYSYYQIVEFNK